MSDVSQGKRGQEATDETQPNSRNSVQEGGSISTISDSITRRAGSPGVEVQDGRDFLSHLRAAGAFESELKNDDTAIASLDDTLRFSSTQNFRQDLASLTELFEVPGPLNAASVSRAPGTTPNRTAGDDKPSKQTAMKEALPRSRHGLQHISNNEETIGRSNNSSNLQMNQARQSPPTTTSLTSIFEEPKPASTKPPVYPAIENIGDLKRMHKEHLRKPSAAEEWLNGGKQPRRALQHVISNDETVGRSNKSSNLQKNQAGQWLPARTSLASLFEEPKPASSTTTTKPPAYPVIELAAPTKPPAYPVIENAPPAMSATSAPQPPQPSRTPPPRLPLSPKSALKTALPRPGTIQHHQRSVSWANPPSAASTPVPTQQEQEHRQDLLTKKASFDSISTLGNDHRRNNTQFTIEDLLGNNAPYEAEAESNIIRALEVQEAARSYRTRTESSGSASLLGHVPESAVHDFSLEDEEEQRGSSSFAPLSPSQSRTSKDGSLLSEKRRLLRRTKKISRHRRDLSVEQTLVGLTHAMSVLHGGDQATARRQDEPFSSANAFAENATRLSEQQDEPALPSHVRRNTRTWRFDNLPMVEEDRLQTTNTSSVLDGEDTTGSEDENGQLDQDLEAPQYAADAGGDDEETNVDSKSTTQDHNRRSTTARWLLEEAEDKLKGEWEAWGAFFSPRKAQFRTYVKTVLLYVIIPLTGIAGILFYFCGNPYTGTSNDGSPGNKPSISWWLLFAVREVITFSMALAMQALVVDFLALGTKVMLKLVGPVLTLLIVQSKGWPFICFWWAVFNFAMLASGGAFAHHWLFWQNGIGLFNAENPSGNVASSELHTTILIVAVCVCVAVAVKRFAIGLHLGRQTFTHYGEKLAELLNSMLLVSEVAGLAKDIEKSRVPEDKTVPVTSETFGWEGDRLQGITFSEDGTQASSKEPTIIDTTCRDPLTGSLPAHERAKLMQLLGQWEEPIRASDPRQSEVASISSVLRFRKALTFIQQNYPFSYAFGPADTRENCIESAQIVYRRLLMRTPGKQVLEFETLALIALEEEGDSVDQQRAKDLLKLFRPDREGHLTMLDFVKSVDSVYRDFRMLNASIQNSSQIDQAFENIFNVIFYIALFTIILSLLGFNPLAVFLSLSSILLGFAFMIGTASSKYFEGVLFILLRRPYGIGDRIHISGVELDTSIEGSPGWVVENVTLFETIATWTPTKERCSLSNGSLASSRIINAARSPQAQFHIFLKLPIDTPYDKILIFKTAIEEYMKARPREWLALNGFRAHRIVADQGYVEYVIVIQHRESWQNIGQILESKANLSSYCNECCRQLNMHYRAPPLPVDLRYLSSIGSDGKNPNHLVENVFTDDNHTITTIERDGLVKEFRQSALNKHNIRLS